MEFEGVTQECKREDDFSSRSRIDPWIIVASGSKLIGGVENRKLTRSDIAMKKKKDEIGKISLYYKSMNGTKRMFNKKARLIQAL